jgi:3'(2'), 5'-bisphosphate nucleotidase
MSDTYTDPALLQDVIAIARIAGAATLPYYRKEKRLAKQHKPDKTMVTQADLIADEIVREHLFGLDYSVPTLTEETASHFSWKARQQWSAYWLVDPLDGTRGFVQGDSCYTVNIALIIDHRPVLGVIYAPVSDRIYYGTVNQGSFMIEVGRTVQRLKSVQLNWGHLRVTVGRFDDIEPNLSQLRKSGIIDLHPVNSSYKICTIAKGEQDIYPKFTETSEWDTAAGQVILEEAGGVLVDVLGQPLTYNRKDSLINPSFLALGDTSQLGKVLNLVF